MDSILSVNWINKTSTPPWKAIQVISHIWHLLSALEKFKVTHVWREANRATNFLAGLETNSELGGCTLQFSHASLLSCDLLSILQEDKEDKLYSRIIY